MVRRSPNSSAAGVQQVRKTAVAPVHFHYSCLFFLERNPKVVCRRVRVCRHSRPNRCCIAFSYHKWSTRSFYSTSIHGVHSSLGSALPPTTFQWFPLILYTAVCAADCYHVQSSAPPPIYVYIHTQEHLFAVSSSTYIVSNRASRPVSLSHLDKSLNHHNPPLLN